MDRRTEFSSLYRVCITCSAVKRVYTLSHAMILINKAEVIFEKTGPLAFFVTKITATVCRCC